MPDAAGEFLPIDKSLRPLTFGSLTRYWDRGHKELKVRNVGSDYCDVCTSAFNDIDGMAAHERRHSALSTLLSTNCEKDKKEHAF